MSKIIRGIPEGATQKTTIINFEAVKGECLEEKNRQAQWIQERQEQSSIKPVDAHRQQLRALLANSKRNRNLKKQDGIIPPETPKGEI
jgi:hypothetical protein